MNGPWEDSLPLGFHAVRIVLGFGAESAQREAERIIRRQLAKRGLLGKLGADDVDFDLVEIETAPLTGILMRINRSFVFYRQD